MALIPGEFVQADCGATYGIGRHDREGLLKEFRHIHQSQPGGPGEIYFLILAKQILSVPKSVSGDLIECGCYKGKSTLFLSVVAEMVGRKLWVCDSFQGLPQEAGDMLYTGKYMGHKAQYAKGDFCGTLEEVQSNLRKLGRLEICEFVQGYFNQSLSRIPDHPYVFGMLDVDLVSSTKDCLLHIWPRLQENCTIYSDDAGVVEIEKIFFDDVWWQQNFSERAPGFVGSGCGLYGFPSLGCCLKKSSFDDYPVFLGAKN